MQYHPELPLGELADAVRRQADDIIDQGLARDGAVLEAYVALIGELDQAPERRDLAWQLGLDRQVTDPALRRTELSNFIRKLVEPARSERSRA